MDLDKLLNELYIERRRLEEMIRTLEVLASSRSSDSSQSLDYRKLLGQISRREKVEPVSSISS